MSVTFREYFDLKNNSIVALLSLISFFGLFIADFGTTISILVFAIYLVFNLRWLYSAYSLFGRETNNSSSTPKKVILANFVPVVCFYRPFYNILELLKFAGKNKVLAYFNWFLQLVSIVYAVVKAFSDQDFSFLYFTIFAWVCFSFYLYQGVNSKVENLVG